MAMSTVPFLLMAQSASPDANPAAEKAPAQPASPAALEIVGAQGEIADNVRLILGKPPTPDNQQRITRYIQSIPDSAAPALSAYGYYNAEVSAEFTPAREDDGKTKEATVRVFITLNEPVLITDISVEMNGEGRSDPTFQAGISSIPLTIGQRFISSEYESSKSSLIDLAQNRGYFDFQFTKSQVRVSRRNNSAEISLNIDTGKRYTFGKIVFQQQTFSNTFLSRWVPFKQGDYYESGLIGELTQNLQSSGYFSSVRVTPLTGPRYKDVVPVTIELQRKEQNQVAVGVGFATDTGFRTRLTWGLPVINRRGHSANASLGFSRDTQSLSLAYRIPRSKQPIFNYWGLEYGLRNDNEGDVDSFLSTLNFQRASRTSSLWTESLFIRWERETFTTSGDELTTDLVLPGVSYSRTKSEGSPFPTRGQTISFQLLGGSKRALSSIDFLKFSARIRYLRAVSDRNTLIASLQYGALNSSDDSRVPVSQRFFAGGDQSVRGFAFRQISPLDSEGEATGGRYLETASLEYNYRFRDLWSAAVFSDAGRAFNDFDTGYSVGAGIGLRWQSPVGPFRVDLAAPISDNDEGGFRVHLSLGSEF